MHRSHAALVVIAAIALLHAAFFITYQRPDWGVAWTDQGGYRMLARGLVATGNFTRYPESPEFVPEAIRTPGYPLFVAAIYALFGDSQMAVVTAQAFVFALLTIVVYWTARHVASHAVALAAAAAVAAYPTFPYFGALTLTELWTTFVLTCGMCSVLRGVVTGAASWLALGGVLIGLTSLTRPGFFLLPAFLALPALVHIWQSQTRWRTARQWMLFLVGFALIMGPWFAYNHRHFGQITLSAAGNLGRPIWEASWQGYWAGRTQAQLTRIADQAQSPDELAAMVDGFAAEQKLPAAPMLEYTTQWRTIRKIWNTPTDPEERVRARIIGDVEYLNVGLANIERDPMGYVRRRLTRGLFVLWAADVPIRFTQIESTPAWIIRAFWAVQAVLVLLALYGTYGLWQQRGALPTLLLFMPLVYVTAVHLPILCEARQSLPVKPLLLLLATLGVVTAVSKVTSRQTSGS